MSTSMGMRADDTRIPGIPRLAPARVVVEPHVDGGWVLRSPEPLGAYARCVGEWLERWARETPDALALAERTSLGEWRRLDYGGLRAAVGALGQALLDLDLPPGRPLVVLSDASIDHALLMLAGMHVGRPVATVSSAYSRLTKDYGKIAGILRLLEPALVYASDAATYGPVLRTAALPLPCVLSHGADEVPGSLPLSSLLGTRETPAVARAFEALTPDHHAKYLLTSGSTGHPKVVINTHRMLTANQQMIAQAWRFLEEAPPVVLDWLPWSHTFGGNHNLNLVLRNGGALYLDDGRPVPGLVERTVANLREVRPTIYFNVPRGFDVLLPFLESDEALARTFFERLEALFYAGAALPQATWSRLEAVAARVRSRPVWFTTAWGSTETAPAVTSAHWRLDRAGVIGLPLPGAELKLVPSGEKLELRVRGPAVFPGYRGEPELTRQAFDAEGYYLIGDAGKFLDPEHPERGVVFDGRVAEDFKLTSGTWVSVGTLRLRVVSALAPWAQDVVITGHDRHEVGALVFPSAKGLELPPEVLAEHVRGALVALLAEGGSSRHPTRARVLTEPLSVDAGELTDKGYVNQRAVLTRRAAEVASLYAEPRHPHVLYLG